MAVYPNGCVFMRLSNAMRNVFQFFCRQKALDSLANGEMQTIIPGTGHGKPLTSDENGYNNNEMLGIETIAMLRFLMK